MFDIQRFAYQTGDLVTVGQMKTALERFKKVYAIATDAEFLEMLKEVLPIAEDEKGGDGEYGDGEGDGDGGNGDGDGEGGNG